MNVFNELLENPLNRLVEQAVEDGRIPIGYSCAFVPEALLMADRLFPVRIHAPGVSGTEIADIYLSNFICSYTRSILEFAVDGRYDQIQGWVSVPSCAHMQRLIDNFEYLKKPSFSHVLDVPRKASRNTKAWLAEELRMFAERLSSHFNVDMSNASLIKAIGEWNAFAELIQAVGELRKRPNPPMSGTDFHDMLMASLASPKDLIMPVILDYKRELENRKGIEDYRARVMLAGSHLQDPQYIHVIESQGALIVADRFCTGSMPGLMPVEMNGDPFMTLAAHCFRKTLCPHMMEDFNTRLTNIIDTAREYKVDGVIIEIMKFCDLWGVDAMPLVSALRKEGIPVLKLEREYRLGSEGQLRTRVQAFIESMGK